MAEQVAVLPGAQPKKHVTEHKHGGLGELEATAICGNDITSSCLYVSALAIMAAGAWAPVALLGVAGVLFLFRSIYGEVVGALPLNGGAYNALLNTTSKWLASMAACLTLLSYMATAVISSLEAMHYFDNFLVGLTKLPLIGRPVGGLWNGIWGGLRSLPMASTLLPAEAHFPIMSSTIFVLAVFMALTILGISESARVAVFIFITHMVTLTILLVVGLAALARGGLGTLQLNLDAPLPAPTGGNIMIAIFFGFSAAMLGISGFESSSNFVEEQAEGVFPKTLRNMWLAVSIFNPAMAFLALALVPSFEAASMAGMAESQSVAAHSEALLAHMGYLAGGETFGPWLQSLISLDAALVLNGAVLTSFIGVSGLVRRMTLDRVLPQSLLKTNRRGSTHRIIIAFFLLSASVLFITRGELEALAGVYTLSFLSVMALFGFGNILLKVRRARLPRPEHATWLTVLAGILAVMIGLVGNAVRHPDYLRVFLAYFFPTALVVGIMLSRIGLLRVLLFFVHEASESIGRITEDLTAKFLSKIDEINSQQIVFFTRGDNAAMLHEAMQYVRNNEHTNRMKVVTVVQPGEEPAPGLAVDLEFMDRVYPDIDVEFVVIEGTFGPDLIHELADRWNIPPNFMFIGSPGDHFLYGLAELGGVRLIV
jgi:amino acid transporter